MFKNIYNDKKVLITGNTGFKGSWLSLWLHSLGAKVYGLSVNIPTTPSNYETSEIYNFTSQTFIDIVNNTDVLSLIDGIKPDFIFHLAAQPIVQESYADPYNTMNTNIMGTVSVLEALRILNHPCIAVFITSDKCYNNVEWVWGYKETDALGGKDPYSASKGAAELMIKTYSESYFKSEKSNVKVASGRAGNVIGGGDWAAFRIIPDAIRAWYTNKELIIRSPKATRPWQHVLEPLSGYLRLGQLLCENKDLCGESFNFGPKPDTNLSVEQLLIEMAEHWDSFKWRVVDEVINKEAGLLKLNCDKALFYLDWVPNLNANKTIQMVAEWYKHYYNNSDKSMQDFTSEQIREYESFANKNGLAWVK
ncbi:MAG: CDP-glucose 4,6-dehydratase [Bacteroidetes bacterium GWF2_42_66]|nr:MAG: CDP-glucose 4,6-dehydratase [Bacteroidetes bacterium GWA2_42_15]OFX96317.1 MAG: CDP-glucose 4,6-dehydratase [Bacteroidetes bacterium GWE2_42_39]OFY46356.1 MAG: CDP-glucose 4,6-dehydratase [Bacteroidetes bacterium GWF2_42_66]HAZ03478.1 CDP-glucose 4,6-dehydratase [Marinilabiliales bacterium]HBL78258.1 CDP-glucose 4,6-dehydratase [Prolixibacteraceae bacterium]